MKTSYHRLILDWNFWWYQKLFLLIFGASRLTTIIEFLAEPVFTTKAVIFFLIDLILFLVFTGLAFSRKGLLKKDQKLYRATFLGKLPIYKRKIDLADRPVVSILKYRSKRKFAFFSAAKPDLGESFNSFQVYVLDEKHLKRDPVLRFNDKENAGKTVEFICDKFRMKHEVFSPITSRYNRIDE